MDGLIDWEIVGTNRACVRGMSAEAEELKRRTMRFALDVCALIRQLPNVEPGPVARHQLARSSTSVAFNYRAACRARSHAEFTAKIGLVSEESDESLGWLEFIEAAQLVKSSELGRLLVEADELCAVFSASAGTARAKERIRKRL
jgi:four helix bundle protein